MALKTVDQNPLITDTVLLQISTPDANNCYKVNPYKVDQVQIWYVERDFLGTNYGQFDKVQVQSKILQQVLLAQKKVCDDPTEANMFTLQRLTGELQSTTQTTTFYYKNAVLITTIGNALNPAWLSTDVGNSYLTQAVDASGNALVGQFTYQWNPNGSVREGDYFLCWSWTPLPAGNSLFNHTDFTLFGNPAAVITIPSHLTPPDKYNSLLERYLPDMYKMYLSQNDMTPDVTDKLNGAIADGFMVTENLANQLIDLFDANALHESLLVYLSNLFNLRLKSSDPTLWRRQIKEAVGLFKKKGTLGALTQAFSQAGMSLKKVTRLWQVVSKYTWQESFRVQSSPTFILARNIVTPIDPQNFALWIRRQGSDDYNLIPNDSVIFTTDECGLVSTMTWVGDEKSAGSIQLFQGDILKILYQFAPIQVGQQAIENYIRALPLSDNRDERAQDFPLKNWNVKVIEEDDPLFDVIIPVRNPFQDPVVFGKVRTEFPYSENIYNMEEYNGSTRDSFDACMIDKDFIDPCGSCTGSKFSIDVGIENISDDRIAEVYDILSENKPFHAVVQHINLTGEVHEYVLSPVEEIDFLININRKEIVLSGNANPFFTRVMPGALTISPTTRSDLAHDTVRVSGKTGIAYNDYIALVATNVNLLNLGIIVDNHILEVLSPSANSGTYTLANFAQSTARVLDGVVEPVDQSMFTYMLSNNVYATAVAKITQHDSFIFTDSNTNLLELGIKGVWDLTNTPGYTGQAWSILIQAYSANAYTILMIDSSGNIFLDDPDRTLPTVTTSNIHYILLDDQAGQKASGHTGNLSVVRRGLVDLNDSGIADIQQYVSHDEFLVYSGIEYSIGDITGNTFHIQDYGDGDALGVRVILRKRLVDKGIGYFAYSGLKLQTPADHEVEFAITNGRNPPVTDQDHIKDNSNFKENFMVLIGNDFYKVEDIDSGLITLGGMPQDWGTLLAGGTSVKYSIHQFVKTPVSVQFIAFDQLDRRGKDPVIRDLNDNILQEDLIVALSLPPGSDVQTIVGQQEGVSLQIEYKNGKSSLEEI